jgi:hypothetical protein
MPRRKLWKLGVRSRLAKNAFAIQHLLHYSIVYTFTHYRTIMMYALIIIIAFRSEVIPTILMVTFFLLEFFSEFLLLSIKVKISHLVASLPTSRQQVVFALLVPSCQAVELSSCCCCWAVELSSCWVCQAVNNL